ncbi:hypothetical protein GBAR_LOCUS2940 [Geodia barretti]|uniref:Uncharacterized protein n=1 Tax=Geodia barretti TaxID=519541 RepID=A0AA35VZH4_GEOBA|nr:hypothetical protein GBAR_LOCUS2940 [Geodia barretti]
MPDFAPFNDNTIDTIFVTVGTLPGSGEVSVAGGGKNGRANLTFFISVECSPGYGGDDCLSVNTCSELIACNLTLGYCNTPGECVCHDGTTQCRTNVTEPNGTTAGECVCHDGTTQCRTNVTEPNAAEPDVISNTTAIVIGAVCSATFLTIGVLVGVVGLYLIQRVRGRSSGPTSSSPPPLPPPVTYEEVGAAREVKSSEYIQLTPNEAYGPVLNDNIPTSHNTA